MDDQKFRDAMSTFASGVTVIGLRDTDGRFRGITVSAFSSVSMTPPIVLACIARSSACNDELSVGVYFGVSILSAGQAELARHFAKASGSKFGDVPFRFGRTSVPLLNDATTQLECVVRQRIEAGDHIIVLGEVIAAEVTDAPPLVYAQRNFHKIGGDCSRAA
jgi:flavin reductase (DIM6/NTAB) family NADH-FMN oxidoreductase RutF